VGVANNEHERAPSLQHLSARSNGYCVSFEKDDSCETTQLHACSRETLPNTTLRKQPSLAAMSFDVNDDDFAGLLFATSVF
jgi:hypothetical protein